MAIFRQNSTLFSFFYFGIDSKHYGDFNVKKSKNYRVIVNGHREEKTLSVVEPVVYYLSAENEEKAIATARKKFGKEHPDAVEVKAAINEKQSIVAILCLAFACLLDFVPWFSPVVR